MSDELSRLRFVRGARAEALERLKISSIRELFFHIPRRYLDFSSLVPIGCADTGKDATIIGTVDKVMVKTPRPRMVIVEVYVLDDTGILCASFFRQPWIKDSIHKGDVVALSGKVSFSYGFKQMKSPFWEKLGSSHDQTNFARILPVHPVTEGLSAAWMRRIMSAALADYGDVCDYLPAELVATRGFFSRARAFREIHFPQTKAACERARKRLAYDELLCLQLALLTRRRIELKDVSAHTHVIDGPHKKALLENLGFELTSEQKQAVDEILQDMASPEIMNRLLLGDVGTGKTAVCAVALAAACDSGSQAAVMAPTSVLARQYAEKLGPVLDKAGISWALITGASPSQEREQATRALANGELTCVFGTTAILSDDVSFARLSLVVVDEQHRFGVSQRTALREKGLGADMLTMTATPIPRTLALSLYGDLSLSRILKRPKAGSGVSTQLVFAQTEHVALEAMAQAFEKKQQAYVICPLIDDSDEGGELDDVPQELRSQSEKLHSATRVFERLSRDVFPDKQVGLLTGRMTQDEKDACMDAFNAGSIDVLVSTTVVEVGVDVPNATVMLIYDADRFGLATLHQLRGRVGRGDVAGVVYLWSMCKEGSVAKSRLNALEQTEDGFALAELDLKLRHEGELLGYRQSGGVSLNIADLAEDAELIEWAHQDARLLAASDPLLSLPEHRTLAHEVYVSFGAYFDELERA